MAKKEIEIAVIIGARGTGKTTKARKIIENYPKNRRKLVMDTQDSHNYRDFGTIQPHQIPGWKPVNGYYRPKRIYQGNPMENLQAVQRYYKNGILVLEDCRKYIGSQPDKAVENFFIDSKQNGVEILLNYHSFRAVPKMVWDYTDVLTVCKTKQGLPKDQKNRIPDFETVAQAVETVQNATDPYKSVTLEIG
jgi:hypothetical protein